MIGHSCSWVKSLVIGSVPRSVMRHVPGTECTTDRRAAPPHPARVEQHHMTSPQNKGAATHLSFVNAVGRRWLKKILFIRAVFNYNFLVQPTRISYLSLVHMDQILAGSTETVPHSACVYISLSDRGWTNGQKKPASNWHLISTGNQWLQVLTCVLRQGGSSAGRSLY